MMLQIPARTSCIAALWPARVSPAVLCRTQWHRKRLNWHGQPGRKANSSKKKCDVGLDHAALFLEFLIGTWKGQEIQNF